MAEIGFFVTRGQLVLLVVLVEDFFNLLKAHGGDETSEGYREVADLIERLADAEKSAIL